LAAALGEPPAKTSARFTTPLNGGDFDPSDLAGYLAQLTIKSV
jgi:hypothetical protein